MAKCFAIRWEENFSGNNKLFRVSFGYCWCCCRRVRRLMQCRLNMKCMPSFANSLTFVFFCQIPEFVRCVLVCAFFLSPSSLHHVNFDIKKHIHWHWAQRHAHDIWYGCKISRNYSFRSAQQKNEKKNTRKYMRSAFRITRQLGLSNSLRCESHRITASMGKFSKWKNKVRAWLSGMFVLAFLCEFNSTIRTLNPHTHIAFRRWILNVYCSVSAQRLPNLLNVYPTLAQSYCGNVDAFAKMFMLPRNAFECRKIGR